MYKDIGGIILSLIVTIKITMGKGSIKSRKYIDQTKLESLIFRSTKRLGFLGLLSTDNKCLFK